MNAWTIYWILQLDSIGFVFGMFLIAGLIYISFSLLAIPVSEGDILNNEGFCKWLKRSIAITAGVALIASLLPSTKTAAAMVIVPALANNETVRKESGELYDLAKQALRDAVTDKAKDAAKEAAK